MPHAITVDQTGGPEVLLSREIAVSDPGPGEVLIRHHAAGLNFIDIYFRRGLYPHALPFIPGVEGAGTVEAVGEGVTDFQTGDRVAYVWRKPGAYADVRVIEARRLVKLPDAISFEEAAALMLKGLTTQMLLRRVYRVQKGDTILVHAAAGGVGLLLCEWASHLGATVIGTVSTEEKGELAHRHGCHHPIVYTKQDFVVEVSRLTGGAKLPVVYDSVGANTFLRSLDCVRRRGMLVSFGQASGAVASFDPLLLSAKGSLFLTRPLIFDYIDDPSERASAAAELFDMVASKKLQTNIHHRHPLRDVAAAHTALESRQTTGSTVLLV